MSSNFRRKVWIGASIIGISLFVAGIGTWWIMGQMDQEVMQIAKARGQIEQRGKLYEMLAEFKRVGPEIDMYAGRLQRLLPNKDNLLDFPRQLENLARVYGVSLNFAFQAESQAQEGQLGSLGFTMDTRGSYSNILKFFRALETESSQFLIILSNVDLSQTSEGYRAATQGRVFFQK